MDWVVALAWILAFIVAAFALLFGLVWAIRYEAHKDKPASDEKGPPSLPEVLGSAADRGWTLGRALFVIAIVFIVIAAVSTLSQ